MFGSARCWERSRLFMWRGRGCACAVNSALLAGATVVLEPRFDATRMLGLVAEHGVTMIEGVPAMYAMLLDALATTVADFTTVTRCTVGGQTISDAVVEAWEKATGAPLLELWGMTELSGLATTHAAYAPRPGAPSGWPFPGPRSGWRPSTRSPRTRPRARTAS